MNGYWVEYESDTIEGNTRKFEVSYKRINEAQDTVERFSLSPNVIYNRQNTKLEATNPSTKRYLDKDIFTYIAALPVEQMDVEAARSMQDSLQYSPLTLTIGDTVENEEYAISASSVSTEPVHPEYNLEPGDLAVQAAVTVKDLETGSDHMVTPIIFLRENLIYTIPEQVNDLNLRIRMSQQTISDFYPRDDQLPYQSYTMRQGDHIQVGEWDITLAGIDRVAKHAHYSPQEGDIAVNAIMTLKNANREYTVRPLFFIRGNSPAHLKAYIPEVGIHIRFENIFPQSEEFQFSIAVMDSIPPVNIEIAKDVPRNDIIVLQAIVFPGINFFWLGSCMMMFGLFLAMARKLRDKQTA